MAATARQAQRPWLIRVTPQMVIIFLVAAGAAAWTIRRADGMWDMPGTTGYSFVGFIGMWALMMVAMMLPSVAPFASMYSRTVTSSRLPRLALFASGYLVVWAMVGVPAYALARLADRYAGGAGGTALAASLFLACGIYQLTPLKNQCLAHCRTPLGHLLHFASFKGPIRDLRAGVEHGFFCLACCWSLMALLIAFGVMNVPVMIVLAAAIATEKIWSRGELAARGIGVAALVAAVAVIWFPGLAPGLTNGPADTLSTSMNGGEMGDGEMDE
ncbi:MAG TPA: DUF2182 domain-containing protein [Tepidiformaceae bacterium]|nr:DUF2182 domain-containing protein [Tepidiformaceae bacterium]